MAIFNRNNDYMDCVNNCKTLFGDDSKALVACINGCAKVNAPTDEEVAPESTPPLIDRISAEHGDILIEIDSGSVLKKSRGKLLICTCVEYDWSCHTEGNGTTKCYKVCKKWKCRELPTDLFSSL